MKLSWGTLEENGLGQKPQGVLAPLRALVRGFWPRSTHLGQKQYTHLSCLAKELGQVRQRIKSDYPNFFAKVR